MAEIIIMALCSFYLGYTVGRDIGQKETIKKATEVVNKAMDKLENALKEQSEARRKRQNKT